MLHWYGQTKVGCVCVPEVLTPTAIWYTHTPTFSIRTHCPREPYTIQLSPTNHRTTFPFGLTFDDYQEEICTCWTSKNVDKYHTVGARARVCVCVCVCVCLTSTSVSLKNEKNKFLLSLTWCRTRCYHLAVASEIRFEIFRWC